MDLLHNRFNSLRLGFSRSPGVTIRFCRVLISGLIIGLIRDLFVPYVDSLMGREPFMRTKCFEPMQKLRARVWIQ